MHHLNNKIMRNFLIIALCLVFYSIGRYDGYHSNRSKTVSETKAVITSILPEDAHWEKIVYIKDKHGHEGYIESNFMYGQVGDIIEIQCTDNLKNISFKPIPLDW